MNEVRALSIPKGPPSSADVARRLIYTSPTIWHIWPATHSVRLLIELLGTGPPHPKTRLLLSLSKTVNKPLPWRSQAEAGERQFG